MFLKRPTPHNNESLESFFIRVANKNGYDDVHRFLEATKRKRHRWPMIHLVTPKKVLQLRL